MEQFDVYHQTPLEIAVGTAVCAGAALLPDLDMSGRVISGKGGATVANTFGRVSLFVAEVLEKVSHAVYTLTRMRNDPDRHNGHRTLTHTIPFTVGVGALTTWGCAAGGKWAVIGILFLMLGLALRGLFHTWAAAGRLDPHHRAVGRRRVRHLPRTCRPTAATRCSASPSASAASCTCSATSSPAPACPSCGRCPPGGGCGA